MKIQKINWQNRRDFEAVYECEHCGHTETRDGYDDDYFHNIVIPNMECPQCHKKASAEYQPRETKYGANEIV